MPETAIYVPLFTPESTAFSEGNKVDIVGVGSSNLPMPTIQLIENNEDAGVKTKFPVGSTNLWDRFWAKVEIHDVAECWPWIAAKTGNGYGNFKSASYGNIPAHRMAYWLSYGEYPDRLLVRHKCDNPVCCNPYHLELGTHAENAQDKVERGRHRNGHTGPIVPKPERKVTSPKHPKQKISYAQQRIAEIRGSVAQQDSR